MAEGDRHHARGDAPGRARRSARRLGTWLSRLFLVLVLVVVGAGVYVWRADRVEEVRDRVQRVLDDLQGREDPPTPASPAAVAAPAGLDLPAVSAAPAVAAPIEDDTTAPVPDAMRQALLPGLADRDLGRHALALVSDLGTGAEVFRKGSGAAIPASTTKLLTAAAALQSVGPETRFTTEVVAGGPGTIVLVGGGDPFLERVPEATDPGSEPGYPARADLTTLAQQTAASLIAAGTTQVQVGYDDSLFPGPAVNPAWPADYVPDGVVAPITALWADEGRPAEGVGRVADPSLAATQGFVTALQAAGVAVTGPPTRGTAAPTGQVLGSVQSAPLREIVQRVLEVSDNEGAEVLAHQVAISRGLPGTFADGAAAVSATLAELGVTSGVTVFDGSGLSRRNRVEPAALVGVLRAAVVDATHPRLETLATSLPVAGFTGSLADRFASAPAAGRGVVRAKTGTLTGVSSLAGIVVDATGHPYLFALMADRVAPVDELAAEAALDAAAAAVAACTCSAP